MFLVRLWQEVIFDLWRNSDVDLEDYQGNSLVVRIRIQEDQVKSASVKTSLNGTYH